MISLLVFCYPDYIIFCGDVTITPSIPCCPCIRALYAYYHVFYVYIKKRKRGDKTEKKSCWQHHCVHMVKNMQSGVISWRWRNSSALVVTDITEGDGKVTDTRLATWTRVVGVMECVDTTTTLRHFGLPFDRPYLSPPSPHFVTFKNVKFFHGSPSFFFLSSYPPPPLFCSLLSSLCLFVSFTTASPGSSIISLPSSWLFCLSVLSSLSYSMFLFLSMKVPRLSYHMPTLSTFCSSLLNAFPSVVSVNCSFVTSQCKKGVVISTSLLSLKISPFIFLIS